MGKVVQFKKIADEITIREDGVGVVTIRGAARLTGVSPESISQALRSVKQKPNKLAQTLIEEGFDSVNLAAMQKGGITDEAMAIIAHYYAYDAGRYCKPEAKHTSKQFDKLGARTAFYGLKGLTPGQSPTSAPKIEEPATPKPRLELPSISELLKWDPTTQQQQQPQIPEPEPQPTPPVEVLPPQQQPEIATPVEKARQVQGVVAELLKNVQLGQTPQEDKVLKAQVAVSAIQAHCPELADALNPVKDALANTTAPKADVTYFTPTVLGERLGVSARAFNKRLKQMGLQVENGNPAKGESAWLPTEAGKAYSIMDVGSEHRLVWSIRVLELFDRVLELFDGAASA